MWERCLFLFSNNKINGDSDLDDKYKTFYFYFFFSFIQLECSFSQFQASSHWPNDMYIELVPLHWIAFCTLNHNHQKCRKNLISIPLFTWKSLILQQRMWKSGRSFIVIFILVQVFVTISICNIVVGWHSCSCFKMFFFLFFHWNKQKLVESEEQREEKKQRHSKKERTKSPK